MADDFDQFEDCFRIDSEENQDNPTTEDQDNTINTIDSTEHSIITTKKYKRKKPSFTRQHFEKGLNSKGEEIQICKFLDESGNRCNQTYRNAGDDFDQFEDCFRIDSEENQDNPTTEDQDNTINTIDSTEHSIITTKKYKRKKPSFTRQHFEKGLNLKGEEIQICKFLDESGNRLYVLPKSQIIWDLGRQNVQITSIWDLGFGILAFGISAFGFRIWAAGI
ncbi:hypothetical protein Glove_294g18 [Diversispora epigaea]|uniref:Uncharacterized protein n=1 Tax=Diversispora epigaea TaxID=1348612 RepID=A0A397HZ70_9GLOM|nr:hypothetical protein Glove_294g18 [Diversispora epigaea]